MLQEAAALRKRGKYAEAKQLYNEIIKINPNEVRAYDGLRKIMLSGYDQQGVITLLQKAVKDNPENIDIKQRLYKEYFNVALGNKKLASTLGIEGRILKNVQENYTSFLKGHSNNTNVSNQLKKINNYVDWNVDTENPHTNVPLKKYRKEKFQENKNILTGISTKELNSKLDKLLLKSNPEKRKPHLRELFELTLKGYRKEKQPDIALDLALKYHKTVNSK